MGNKIDTFLLIFGMIISGLSTLFCFVGFILSFFYEFDYERIRILILILMIICVSPLLIVLFRKLFAKSQKEVKKDE